MLAIAVASVGEFQAWPCGSRQVAFLGKLSDDFTGKWTNDNGQHQMAKLVRREIRKRGFFGWLFLLIFLAFNAFMIVWLITYWNQIGGMVTSGSDAHRTGAAIGATLGTGMIFFFWTAGAVITGLLALLTRGRKTYIEETFD